MPTADLQNNLETLILLTKFKFCEDIELLTVETFLTEKNPIIIYQQKHLLIYSNTNERNIYSFLSTFFFYPVLTYFDKIL